MDKIMGNLRNWKDQAKFRGLSITDDDTMTERQLIKQWSQKAKENNSKEAPDVEYVWKVRGTPKNGLRMEKILKKNPITLRQ